MKRFLPSFCAACLVFPAGPLAAQITPQFLYSGAPSASINIFNDSKVINFSGTQQNTATVTGSRSFSHSVEAAGSASQQRSGGAGQYPFSMTVAGRVRGQVSYGHIHFSGMAEITTSGQYFTNAGPTQPQTAYDTGQASAEGNLTLIYNDVLHVESATLPAGSPVVVQAALHAYAAPRQLTSTSPVYVNVPPSGPGFPATAVYQLVTTPTTDSGALNGEARLTSYAAGVTFPSVDDRFLYPLVASPHVVNVNAVVGGRITVNHASNFAISASTTAGKYGATAKGSSTYDLTCRPVTDGVVLRSESGHDYAPPTGQEALMQVYSSPGSLILTAPAGAIFQKGITTPAGLDWLDLTESRMLVVPFDESRGFFRVRQP